MDEPQLLAVLIVIAFFFITLFGGGYLIYRTMNRPNSYIGARMHAEEQRRLQQERDSAGGAAPVAGQTGPASPTGEHEAMNPRDVRGPRGPEDQSPER
ncbi:hypothetical protein [Brevibacterium luteolum]|uniref:Uncharacterized protein n=1 Tax=Brevibacterium luteolum TaxID=199591 RepID=A0A849AXX1_9MICO|nr:hypothetical protein [Brevibacterium luteolum]MBM7530532.1 hypothetical protein [Brevibacterium luteolum]NNG77926.1 hypothetical protein [Brevibacterium luteolum]